MFSIVVPIHNEEAILKSLVTGIITGLPDQDFELVLSENGSSDQTLALAQRLAKHYPQITVLTAPVPNYGRAIRQGILRSSGSKVIIFNADLWDLDFLHSALGLLKQHDIVIASKRHPESQDQRPFNRRFITWAFNMALWLLFSFQGSDTHGMKAFRRHPIEPVLRRCITQREIFDTEIILRAQQAGLSITEVPTVVEELRPSRYSPFERLPRTLKDLGILWRDLYLTRQPEAFSSESD